MKYLSLLVGILLLPVMILAQDSTIVSPSGPTIGEILSIDFKTMGLQEILTLLIPVVTMIWGQIAKLSKSIDDQAPLPKWLIIVVGGFAIAMLISNQGFDLGTMIQNILLVLAGAGLYPGVKAASKMLPFEVKMKDKKPAIVKNG